MAQADEQQFCLRWNNFQANITSQFETLRDDEDFTDVTIACEGQRLQAHKVVLSACSPFFKDLFKSNPCSHPIIFMRDVEAQHVVALMEFMYAGEVNVAQAQLSAFLKTAESLKIRGLTDTSSDVESTPKEEEDTLYLNPQPSTSKHKQKQQISSSSTVTSSQDVGDGGPSAVKRQCKAVVKEEAKEELPDYLSDDEAKEDIATGFYATADVTELTGGMEIIPQTSGLGIKEINSDISMQGSVKLRRKMLSSDWLPCDIHLSDNSSFSWSPDSAQSREKDDSERRNKLVKLGDGIELYEDQLRSVKWSDYRKLTRSLATIMFSPAELATCSVTGQRWSRAGSGERPVKPALDRAKVQAIISYVATMFPMVEISRIKQVLAYKCKENSTAFKMKAVRYIGEQHKN